MVYFLKALFFGHAKGVDVAHSISNIIFNEEFKFPADCLFNLSLDGPNVNKTIWKGMNEALGREEDGTTHSIYHLQPACCAKFLLGRT